MTQAGFLTANIVNLGHFYCFMLNREKIKTMLCSKLSKIKLKNISNFLSKCLIFTAYLRQRGKSCLEQTQEHCLLNISGMTKANFISTLTVQLIYTLFDKLFILVFVTNYPVSWQLLMDIIFSYPLIGQFDTI